MNINQRLVRYLYDYKKDTYIEYNKGDKVAIRTNDNKVISGIIDKIGTIYLYLQTGIEIRFMPRIDGKFSEVPMERIKISDINIMAKYPKQHQKYGIIKMK